MPYAVFNFRARSLVRGTVLVLASLLIAFLLSGFPRVHPAWTVGFPAFAALWGTYETLRCLQLRWSFYHGGVLLLLAFALDGSRHRRNTDFAVAAVELDLAALWARIAIGLVLAFHAAFSFLDPFGTTRPCGGARVVGLPRG